MKNLVSILVGVIAAACIAGAAVVQNSYTVTGNTNSTATVGYTATGIDAIDAERIVITLSTSSAISPTCTVSIVDADGTTLLSTNNLCSTLTTNITKGTGQPLPMAGFTIKTSLAQPTNSAAVYPAVAVTITGRN